MKVKDLKQKLNLLNDEDEISLLTDEQETGEETSEIKIITDGYNEFIVKEWTNYESLGYLEVK